MRATAGAPGRLRRVGDDRAAAAERRLLRAPPTSCSRGSPATRSSRLGLQLVDWSGAVAQSPSLLSPATACTARPRATAPAPALRGRDPRLRGAMAERCSERDLVRGARRVQRRSAVGMARSGRERCAGPCPLAHTGLHFREVPCHRPIRRIAPLARRRPDRARRCRSPSSPAPRRRRRASSVRSAAQKLGHDLRHVADGQGPATRSVARAAPTARRSSSPSTRCRKKKGDEGPLHDEGARLQLHRQAPVDRCKSPLPSTATSPARSGSKRVIAHTTSRTPDRAHGAAAERPQRSDSKSDFRRPTTTSAASLRRPR